MKAKLLLTCIFFFSLFTISAQKNIPKGSLLLGGSLSFSTYNNSYDKESNKSSSFNIAPSIGKAVRENLFIGFNVGVGFYKNSQFMGYPNLDSSKAQSYNYGVFARKYKPLKSNFYVFLQGNLEGYNSKNTTIDNATNKYKMKGYGINASVSPGVSYAISSKFQVETGLNNILGIGYFNNNYQNSQNTPYEIKQTGFNVYTSLNNFTSQLYIGFRLLLQKKEKQATVPKTE